MKKNNLTYLRTTLDEMSTPKLADLLQEELHKEPVNEQNVRMILRVLEEREPDKPIEPGPETEAAWNRYLQQTATSSVKPVRKKNRVLRVASIVAALLLLLEAFPQEAEAKNIFDRLISWTDSIFELLNPGDAENKQTEYVFETDHPGLQQVYDAVVELGVTEPVVPMWMDKSYELVFCEIINTPIKRGVSATFSDGKIDVGVKVDIYSENISNEYYKDETVVNSFEKNGTTHHVMRNNDLWVVVWVRDNVECSIAMDCQEDTLYQVLESIYSMEE